MHRTIKTGFVAVLLISALFCTAKAQSTARELQDVFARVAEKTKPAVVNISVASEKRIAVMRSEYFFFGMPDDAQVYRQRIEGNGSGVIVDPSGYILTNAHVVKDADEITVTRTESSGKEITYPGKVVGTDPFLDLALVKVNADGLPYLKFADSNSCRPGDWAIAIGSPFGLAQTLTVGVISAVRQSLTIEGRKYHNMLQTDASINMGNSGGPLLNLDGEIIGINTAIFSPSGTSAGIGFAIPSAEVTSVMPDLKSGKKIQKGWLGISMAPVDRVMARYWRLKTENGAIVESVVRNSPAHKAGLRRGDIIMSADSTAIKSPQELSAIIARRKAGSALELEVLRNNKKIKLAAVLQEQPQTPVSYASSPRQQEESDAAWEGMELTQGQGGVEITGFKSDSPLSSYLKIGDIISGINRLTTENIEDFTKAAEQCKLSEGVVFDVTRNGTPMYISVQVK